MTQTSLQAVSDLFWTHRLSIKRGTSSGTTRTAPVIVATNVKCTGIVDVDAEYKPKSNPRQIKRFYKVYIHPETIVYSGDELVFAQTPMRFVIHEYAPIPLLSPIYTRVILGVIE